MATDMEVPFLGKVPLDPRIGRCCDEGKSFLSEVPESPAADAYKQIIQSTFMFVGENLLRSSVTLLLDFWATNKSTFKLKET